MTNDTSVISVRPIPWKSFSTLGAAIVDAKESMLVASSQRINVEISGRCIAGIRWTMTSLELAFPEGRVLTFSATASGVTFELSAAGPICPVEALGAKLRFSPGGEPYVWDRPRLAGTRIGRKITRLIVNGSLVFLYVEGEKALLIDVLRVSDTDEPMLFWADSD